MKRPPVTPVGATYRQLGRWPLMADNTKAILKLHTGLARLNADERFDDGRPGGPQIRAFINGWYWANFEGIRGGKERAARACVLAGVKDPYRNVFYHDAPRYQIPDEWSRECVFLKTRGPQTGEPCKASSTSFFTITDLATGERARQAYCYRHKVESDREERAERERTNGVAIPEPLPNIGGLLPGYLETRNWPDIYSYARHGNWKPPAIGIDANDWPVMRKVWVHGAPKLELIDGAADHEGAATPAPTLRLVGA